MPWQLVGLRLSSWSYVMNRHQSNSPCFCGVRANVGLFHGVKLWIGHYRSLILDQASELWQEFNSESKKSTCWILSAAACRLSQWQVRAGYLSCYSSSAVCNTQGQDDVVRSCLLWSTLTSSNRTHGERRWKCAASELAGWNITVCACEFVKMCVCLHVWVEPQQSLFNFHSPVMPCEITQWDTNISLWQSSGSVSTKVYRCWKFSLVILQSCIVMERLF